MYFSPPTPSRLPNASSLNHIKKTALGLCVSALLLAGCSAQPPESKRQNISQSSTRDTSLRDTSLRDYSLRDYSPAGHKAREVHQSVSVRSVGNGENRVYLFVPEQPHLNKQAPIVFLHHGWLGWNPKNFGALIDHLVRTGNVVIYPAYQDSEHTPPQNVTNIAGSANKAALNQLEKQFGILPDPKRILYFGFSMGSAISLNLAQDYQKFGLPAPSALILTGVGDAYHVQKNAPSIIKSLTQLPANLPVVMMTGESDPIGLPTSRKLFPALCHIKPDRRVLMILPTDSHNGRTVNAGHGSPGAPDSRYDFALNTPKMPSNLPKLAEYEKSGSLNQLDFYGYWKVVDEVLLGLKTKTLSPVVFGKNNPAQLSLGTWADGTPFKKIRLEDPCR